MPRSRRAAKTETRKTTTARATARASSSSSGSVTAVVLTDTYAWHDTCNDPSTERHEAVKGEKVTVSADEFKRSQAMTPKGLAKTGTDKATAVAAGEEPADETPLTKPDGDPVEPVEDDAQ